MRMSQPTHCWCGNCNTALSTNKVDVFDSNDKDAKCNGPCMPTVSYDAALRPLEVRLTRSSFTWHVVVATSVKQLEPIQTPREKAARYFHQLQATTMNSTGIIAADKAIVADNATPIKIENKDDDLEPASYSWETSRTSDASSLALDDLIDLDGALSQISAFYN